MIFRFIKTKDSQFLIRLKNMFIPDYSHIHHSLQKIGFQDGRICFILCIVSIIFSLVSIFAFIYMDFFYRSILVLVIFFLFIYLRSKIDKAVS